MIARVSRVWCIALKTQAQREFTTFPMRIRPAALGLPCAPGQLDQGRDRTPVACVDGNEIEMRRSPVLDQRRTCIPAYSAVELLEVATALLAGGDEVALLLVLGVQAHQILRRLVAAEGTLQSREHPATSADVAGQPALPAFRHVREARRRSAEGTDAEDPQAVREM